MAFRVVIVLGNAAEGVAYGSDEVNRDLKQPDASALRLINNLG